MLYTSPVEEIIKLFAIIAILISLIITTISVKKHIEVNLEEKPLIVPKIKGVQPYDERILTVIFGVTYSPLNNNFIIGLLNSIIDYKRWIW